MSNNYQDWDDEDDDFDLDFDADEVNEKPRRAGNDNDLIKKLRRAERSKDKMIKELQQQLDEFKSFQRESTISKVLESKGLNPKVAKFIPADVDPTEDALNQWIGEYGDVFGLQQAQREINPDLAALRQIDQVTQGAVTPDKIENMLLALDQAGSFDEIVGMINGSN